MLVKVFFFLVTFQVTYMLKDINSKLYVTKKEWRRKKKHGINKKDVSSFSVRKKSATYYMLLFFSFACAHIIQNKNKKTKNYEN